MLELTLGLEHQAGRKGRLLATEVVAGTGRWLTASRQEGAG